jgi:hypothetical protein
MISESYSAKDFNYFSRKQNTINGFDSSIAGPLAHSTSRNNFVSGMGKR